MPQISTSPGSGQTLLRLEARKSFSFALLIKDSDGNAVDITDCVFTIVAKPYPIDPADTSDDLNFIANDTATIVDAAAGHARFDLQASDLAMPEGEYPFVIVMLTATGYSVVIVKGSIDLLANTEFSSAGQTYAGGTPAQSLDVYLRGLATIQTLVGSVLPPGMGYISTADQAKLDSIVVVSGAVEVDLTLYALKTYADAAAAAAEAAANAYTAGWAAAAAHTHTVISLDGISSGTAAPTGGSPGDLYIKYVP